MTDDSHAARDAERDRYFMAAVGVSRESLTEQGIDPDDYLLKHAKLGKFAREDLLPASDRYEIRYLKWASRGLFRSASGGLVLAVSAAFPRHSVMHWVGIGIAIAILVGAFTFVGLTFDYRHRYVKACKTEGIKPYWRITRSAR